MEGAEGWCMPPLSGLQFQPCVVNSGSCTVEGDSGVAETLSVSHREVDQG